MQEYINKCCAQCGEKFKEEDDIAVCPHCGTPVHRSCWTGHCPNEEKHSLGYDWDKENSEEKPSESRFKNPSPLADQTVCSICHNPIDDRAVHCPDCGAPMHMKCFLENKGCPNSEHHDGSYYDEDSLLNKDGTPKIYVDSFDSFADKVKKHPVRDRETGEPLTCMGVTQAELVHFLGKDYITTPRYMGIFMRMAMTGKKVAFNLWQGLLMPYYQFYQRMLGPGLILFLLAFIISIPQEYVALQATLNMPAEAEQGFFSLFSAANTAAAEYMLKSPLAPVISVLSYVNLGIQILMAFFGDYLYMRWTVGRILSLRADYSDLPEEEYYKILERKGNPKWSFAFIGVGLTLITSYLFIQLVPVI